MQQPDILTVKGAKYARRNSFDDPAEGLRKDRSSFDGKLPGAVLPLESIIQFGSSSAAPTSRGSYTDKVSIHPAPSSSSGNADTHKESDPYWKKPPTAQSENGDLVVIHVCDENQQVSRDFCCNRVILVSNMRYFERFLGENDGGYEDIDISVHCDVEIFEWLMTYIHDPKHHGIKIDKSIIISILISSEFLQMDELVDVCVEQVAANLNEIIRLPIDLSCVSEKLVNRIAGLTHPKTLCEVKDKKDKILTKLYKRRVELDFSRKGSGSKSSSSSRTIASSLTCCRRCGWVYLESFNASLVCRQSQPSIDFRGRLTSRHAAIPSWSLTSYLKTLHSGGMAWDAIYWHVWAACVVLRADNLTISALEVDRYAVEPDGVLLRSCPSKATDLALKPLDDASSSAPPLSGEASPRGLSAYAKALSAHLNPADPLPAFSLGAPETSNVETTAKMVVCPRSAEHWTNASSCTTPSLHPGRPADVLVADIFELLCSQMKFITGLPHRALLQQTMQHMISSAARADNRHTRLPTGAIDFMEILYGAPQEQYGGVRDESPVPDLQDERRRGRSPARPPTTRASSLEPRRMSVQGMSKVRSSAALPAAGGSPLTTPAAAVAAATAAGNDYDSDGNEAAPTTRKTSSALGERRARSSSTSKRTVGLVPSAPSTSTKVTGRKSKIEGVAMTITDAAVSDDEVESQQNTLDDFIAKQIEILRSMPADLAYKASQQRSAAHGVWLTANPMALHPPALDEALQVVADSNVADSKKIEWELDLMREFDERRIDRMERYLISTRQAGLDPLPATRGKGKASKIKGEYYRDRGRQAFRCVT